MLSNMQEITKMSSKTEIDMRKNAEVTIVSAMNGFIVTPRTPADSYKDVAAAYVFQTFAEMGLFLQEHFTYRNEVVKADKDNDSLRGWSNAKLSKGA